MAVTSACRDPVGSFVRSHSADIGAHISQSSLVCIKGLSSSASAAVGRVSSAKAAVAVIFKILGVMAFSRFLRLVLLRLCQSRKALFC
jgi:hypothetical protein